MFPNYIYPHMEYKLNEIESGRIRAVISNGNKEVATLYFEKAKNSFQNKPLTMNSWRCVDAKVEDETIFNEDFIPKDMIGKCQDLIKEAGL